MSRGTLRRARYFQLDIGHETLSLKGKGPQGVLVDPKNFGFKGRHRADPGGAISDPQPIGKDEDGHNIEILFGALAMQQWGIRPVPETEGLDLSHFTKEFLEF